MRFLQGLAMGMIEFVPGVSSSTLAMFMGFYERLVTSIHELTTSNWKRGLMFLLPLGVGVLGGAVISLFLIDYFLAHYREYTMIFFFGLIAGMLPFLWNAAQTRSSKRLSVRHYLFIAVAIVIVVILDRFGEGEGMMTNLTMSDYAYLFFAGWVGSTALVLPGISGALFLVILGVYDTARHALLTLDVAIIAVIGAGVIIGVLITSKIVRLILTKYPQGSYAAMFGLVAGSLYVVFPENIQPVLIELILVAAILIIGMALSLFLGKFARRQ